MIDGIVLEIQFADAQRLRQAICFDERGESRIEAGPGLAVDRQQLAIAPEVLRTRFDRRAADVGPDLVVVIDDFERSEAFVADPERLRGEHRLAQVTLQSDYVSHISFTDPAEPDTTRRKPDYPNTGTAIGRRTWNGSALISASAASSTDSGHASSVITNGSSALSWPGSWSTASMLMPWADRSAAKEAMIPGRSATVKRT